MRMNIKFVFLLSVLRQISGRTPLSIRIGGVLEPQERFAERTLQAAVDNIDQKDILKETRIDVYLKYVENSPVSAYTATCDQLERSVYSIFSSTPDIQPIISSLAFQFKIPHFSTQLPSSSRSFSSPFSIYLAPSHWDITEITLETALNLRVRKVGLVSHSTTSILETARLVEALQSAGVDVLVLDLAEKDVRPDLAQLRRKGFYTCIVDVADYLIKPFIEQGMQAGLVNSETTFILTSLDFSGVNLEVARFSGAGIIGFSLIDPELTYNLTQNETDLLRQSYKAAVLLDSVRLFSEGIKDLSKITDVENPRVSCQNQTQIYEDGEALFASFQRVSFQGYTGMVQLQGQTREDVDLHILALHPDLGLKKIGLWSRDRRGSAVIGDIKQNIDQIRMVGKDRLALISRNPDLEVETVLKTVVERHGAVYRTVSTLENILQEEIPIYWDTIAQDSPNLTTESLNPEKELDSTLPVSLSDIYLVFKKDSIGILDWLKCILGFLFILLCSSLSLSLSSRISPYQRRVNPYSIQDSIWINVCGLLFRSWDFRLQGVSSRLVSIVWWVFSSFTVLLLSYHLLNPAVNLDLILILQDPNLSIQTLEHSQLHQYLKVSPDPVHQHLSSRVQSSFQSLSQGLETVSSQNNVLIILEGSQLLEVGCEFGRIKVGSRPRYLSMRRGSIWRERLNLGIRTHQSTRSIQTSDQIQDIKTQPCQIDDLNFYYYLAGFGLVGSFLSLLFALGELVFYSVRRTRKSESWWKRLTQELKLMMRNENTDERLVQLSNLEFSSPSRNENLAKFSSSGEKQGSPTPDKDDDEDEPSVTEKLILEKAYDEHLENSRL